jgi:hypothetical protein
MNQLVQRAAEFLHGVRFQDQRRDAEAFSLFPVFTALV